MPSASVLTRSYIGEIPPAVSGPDVIWRSLSKRHLRIPEGPADRKPIAGAFADGTQAQEPSMYWNPILQRHEAFWQINSQQWWAYSKGDVFGPWSYPVAVLGGGVGGESLMAVQGRVFVEGSTVYFHYCRQIGVTAYYMASCLMPTDPTAVPVMVANASPIASTASIGNKGMFNASVCKNPNGGYLMATDSTGNGILFSSPASDPSQWPTQPFVPVVESWNVGDYVSTLGTYSGVSAVARTASQWQRPQLCYENGTWIIFGSAQGVSINQLLFHRWICKDTGTYPINWIKDSQQDQLLRPVHLLEQDQQVDVSIYQPIPGGRCWALWAANNNNFNGPATSGFNIMAAPCIHPEMNNVDGTGWVPIGSLNSDNQADAGWRRCDLYNGSYTALHLDDFIADATSTTGIVLTAPVLTEGVRFRGTNTASAGTNQVALAVQGTDKLSCGNPITAATAVGTTVTITTQAPHGLATGELVTQSGHAPVAYNVTGAAITVTGASTYTYVAGSAPGTNTTLGVYETGLRAGECRAWRCVKQGFGLRMR